MDTLVKWTSEVLFFFLIFFILVSFFPTDIAGAVRLQLLFTDHRCDVDSFLRNRFGLFYETLNS